MVLDVLSLILVDKEERTVLIGHFERLLSVTERYYDCIVLRTLSRCRENEEGARLKWGWRGSAPALTNMIRIEGKMHVLWLF